MPRRLLLWAVAGLVVAGGWALVAAFTHSWSYPDFLWTIMDVTAPAAMLRRYPLSVYSFLAINSLVYLIVGLGVEGYRHRKLARASH